MKPSSLASLVLFFLQVTRSMTSTVKPKLETNGDSLKGKKVSISSVVSVRQKSSQNITVKPKLETNANNWKGKEVSISPSFSVRKKSSQDIPTIFSMKNSLVNDTKQMFNVTRNATRPLAVKRHKSLPKIAWNFGPASKTSYNVRTPTFKQIVTMAPSVSSVSPLMMNSKSLSSKTINMNRLTAQSQQLPLSSPSHPIRDQTNLLNAPVNQVIYPYQNTWYKQYPNQRQRMPSAQKWQNIPEWQQIPSPQQLSKKMSWQEVSQPRRKQNTMQFQTLEQAWISNSPPQNTGQWSSKQNLVPSETRQFSLKQNLQNFQTLEKTWTQNAPPLKAGQKPWQPLPWQNPGQQNPTLLQSIQEPNLPLGSLTTIKNRDLMLIAAMTNLTNSFTKFVLTMQKVTKAVEALTAVQ